MPKIKLAVITGSLGGIGQALVDAFLNANYFVYGLDKSIEEDYCIDKKAELNIDLSRMVCDADYRERRLSTLRGMFPQEIDKLVIINNAAEQILGTIDELTYEDWNESLKVNVLAPFFLAQFMRKDLRENNGAVINVSSIHSRLTKKRFAAYSTSKAALEGVTRALALELASEGVSVNAIAPAAVATDMLLAGFQGKQEALSRLKSYHPSNALGVPADLANLVLAITESNSQFLTGATIEFSGGINAVLHDPD